MASERWRRQAALFDEAVDLPRDQREELLKQRCGNDSRLEKALRSMLRSDAEAPAYLAGPLSDAETAPSVPEPKAGERWIDSYRLLRELGQGGMSTVYEAEQTGTFHRRVALKVIRRGLESAETQRRMRIERQVLAGLEHPNIARLYDGGTTDEQLPYVVMELVDGLPIDQYCDHYRMSLRTRLELFRKVCSAVHEAHQNLVVHRDLKPSNILVTADGEPKLLDFGIAKLLDPGAGADTEPTVAWMRRLTPEYASPEQVQGGKITTASDTYSLGVLLYKLLTDRLPFNTEGRPLSELERLVVERDAPRPSVRMVAEARDGSSEAEAAHELRRISAARGARPQQLRRLLTGDLDTIVLKAVHREPARRYGSAEQLADDIFRHLSGFPVLARPDAFGYRVGRFLRRHWLPASAAALLTLVMVGAAIGLAVHSAKVRLERDQLQEVVSFVVDVFDVAGEGEQLSVKQAVDRSAALLEHTLIEQPAVQATLRSTLGQIYLKLGAAPRAREQLERAVRLRREAEGDTSLAVAESLSSLGVAMAYDGDLEAGEANAREALEIVRQRFGSHHAVVVAPLNNLVNVLCLRSGNDQAGELAREALAMAREVLPEGDLELGHALTHQALLVGRRGEHAEAASLYRQALSLYRRTLGDEHPEIAAALNNLAFTTKRQGEPAAAEDLYRQTLGLQRRLFGDDSSTVAQTLHNLGTLLTARSAHEEAEAAYREAVAIVEAVHGADHYSSVVTATGLAGVLIARERPVDAETLLRQRFDLWQQNLAGSWFLAQAQSVLGECLMAQRRFAEAEPLLESGYRGLLELSGEDFPRTRRALARLAELYEAWDKPALAQRYRALQKS